MVGGQLSDRALSVQTVTFFLTRSIMITSVLCQLDTQCRTLHSGEHGGPTIGAHAFLHEESRSIVCVCKNIEVIVQFDIKTKFRPSQVFCHRKNVVFLSARSLFLDHPVHDHISVAHDYD